MKKIKEFFAYFRNDLMKKISKMFVRMFDCCKD